MITGNWGNSIIAKRPIFNDLLRRLPITIELVILAMGFALLIAVPAGIFAALRPYSWQDYSAMTTAVMAPYSPTQTTRQSLSFPSQQHPMGTDLLGRDVLSRIIYGRRLCTLGWCRFCWPPLWGSHWGR